MSTLVLHHDGLERVIRGLAFLASSFRRGDAALRRRAGATAALPNRDSGVAETSAATAAPAATVAPQQQIESIVAALQHETGRTQSWLSRRRRARARRRAEQAFEDVMQSDPRIRAELKAISTYNEWHS